MAVATVPPGDRPLYLRACALGQCRQTRVTHGHRGAGVTFVHLPVPALTRETSVEVTARLLNARGKVLAIASKQVTVKSSAPKGPVCEPTCWVGGAGYSVEQRRFIPFEQVREPLQSATGSSGVALWTTNGTFGSLSRTPSNGGGSAVPAVGEAVSPSSEAQPRPRHRASLSTPHSHRSGTLTHRRD